MGEYAGAVVTGPPLPPMRASMSIAPTAANRVINPSFQTFHFRHSKQSPINIPVGEPVTPVGSPPIFARKAAALLFQSPLSEPLAPPSRTIAAVIEEASLEWKTLYFRFPKILVGEKLRSLIVVLTAFYQLCPRKKD